MTALRDRMKRILFIVTAFSLLGVAYGIYCLHRVVTVDVPNAYATDWSAGILIEYLKTNDNQWPSSWDDLREPYETLAAPQNYPWSFDELQQRIAIDWAADVSSLKSSQSKKGLPAIKVIWLKDGSDIYWEGLEPNQRILSYLQTLDCDG